jgi:hypothetical protein
MHNTQKTISSVCLAILLSNTAAYSMTPDLSKERQVVAKLTKVISCHDPIEQRDAKYLVDFFSQNPSIEEALCKLVECNVHITTPLHVAIEIDSNVADMTVLKLLCLIPREHLQSVVNQPDEIGRTALQIAAFHGGCYFNVFRLLCDGADVQHKDDRGYTALHWAARARGNNKEIIQQLVNHGASVDQFNKEDQTPLCIAALEGNGENFCTLLELGADAGEINQDYIKKIQSSYDRETRELHRIFPFKDYKYLRPLNKHYEIIRRLPHAPAHRKKTVATILAYTTHDRLGADSPFTLLPYYMLKELTLLATSPSKSSNP